MRGTLVSMYYEYGGGDRPTLHIFLRTERGKEHVAVESPIKPYFFCREKDEKVVEKAIESIGETHVIKTNRGFRTIDGHRAIRFELCNPKNVGSLRKRLDVPLYEADILFKNRVMIDVGLFSSIEVTAKRIRPISDQTPPLRVGYWDIECNDTRGFPAPERDEIVSIALVDSEGTAYFFCENSERKTIEKFLSKAKDFDVLVGWNSDNFDLPYLKKRCWKRKIDTTVLRSINFLDLEKMYKMNSRRDKEQWTLDFIAQEELGEGKLPRRGIMEMFRNDRKALRDYNVRDADLVRRIDQKESLELTRLACEIAAISGVFVEQTMQKTPMITSLVLREALKMDPRPVYKCAEKSEKKTKARGAIVLEPVPGIHENVIVLDFSGMYPSIAMSFNISHETMDPNGDIVTKKARFTSKFDGIYRRVLRDLFNKRKHYKDLMKKTPEKSPEHRLYDIKQRALKVLMNSFYGIAVRPGSRFFTIDVAESITLTGRFLLQTIKSFAEYLGAKVLYGDTDSIFIKIPISRDPRGLLEIANRFAAKITEEVRKVVASMGGDPRYISVSVDKLYKRILLMPKKKRYAGVLWYKDSQFTAEFDIVGFEAIRSDYPIITKRAQNELLVRIIVDRQKRNEVVDYVRSLRDEVLRGEHDTELIMSKGLGKGLDEYAANAMHVRAARKYKQKVGTVPAKVPFVITAIVGGRPVVEPVVDWDKMPQISTAARKYYWDHLIYPNLKKILEAAGFGGIESRSASLFDFVKGGQA